MTWRHWPTDCPEGRLPWPPIKVRPNLTPHIASNLTNFIPPQTGPDGYDDYTPVANEKCRISPEELCAGLSSEFAVFLRYIRSLAFEAKPDYDSMRYMFQNLAWRIGYTPDMPYDWVGR